MVDSLQNFVRWSIKQPHKKTEVVRGFIHCCGVQFPHSIGNAVETFFLIFF